MSGSLEQPKSLTRSVVSIRRYFTPSNTISEQKGVGFVPVIPEIHLDEVITDNLRRVVPNLDPFIDSIIEQTIGVEKIPDSVEDRRLEGYIPAANVDAIKEFFRRGLVSGRFSDGGITILDLEQILQVRALIRLKRISWSPKLVSALHEVINERLYKQEPSSLKEAI